MKIGLTLLNFNEIESLPVFLGSLNPSGFEKVFVVDGGSSDGSRQFLQAKGYEVIVQTSRGRGDAFKIAFQHALKMGLDGLVFISTDGNESPEDLPRFIQGLQNGNDLVIGSRMIHGARNEEDDQFFRPRKIANKVFAQIAYLVFASGMKKITDPINGYRAITTIAWGKMSLGFQGFDIEYAMSIQAYKKRLRVLEFPTIEKNRLGGKSGARAVHTTFSLMKVLWRMR
jgi:glycosyltransferase involved in cell wall biosynthesis